MSQPLCHVAALALALLCIASVKPIHVVAAVLWLLVLLAVHELSGPLPDRPVRLPTDAAVTVKATPRTDLYGNEIQEAVGDYRVDRRGELYERHAPDTAVLRLGPPGT